MGQWWTTCRSQSRRRFSLRSAPGDVKGEEFIGVAPREKGCRADACGCAVGLLLGGEGVMAGGCQAPWSRPLRP